MSVVDPAVPLAVAPAIVQVADVPILLVEDDHGDAVLVQGCLSEVGVLDTSITWARTLAEATAALHERPGCVLLDLGLPDADGYGAVSDMVAAAPDVPVIVLTGRQERDGMDALAAGAQDYLVKDSLSGDRLERSIRYAVERKRAQQAQQQLREISLSAAEQARLERGLLPTPLLRTDAVSCATYYRPGRDDAVLGGDFFDVIEVSPGRIRGVIGDVMGHGPDEAALGVHLRVAWRTLLFAGTPDAQILPTLARLLNSEMDPAYRYVTVCDVTIEDDAMTVRVAGHPAPIVCRPSGVGYLDTRVGLPLGIRIPGTPERGWPEVTVPLPRGSSVLLYTDGLLDAFYGAGTTGSIGVDELVRAVHSCAAGGVPAEAWIPKLLENAPRDPIDDTALVVLTTSARG